MKTCFKCGQGKPLSDFYRHPAMADGHLGKCKACARADVIANRMSNVNYYRSYDVMRNKRPERKASFIEKQRRMRKANRHLSAAHDRVRTAVKNGVLSRPIRCQRCRSTGIIQGHHDDHARPLDVIWLCPPCHAQRHVELGRIKTASN